MLPTYKKTSLAERAKESKYVIETFADCPHGYQAWLAEHPAWSKIVANKVLEFSM